MELTKSHLKQLQRQLNKPFEGSTPTLSDSRIDILLIHEDQIPIPDISTDSDKENGEETNVNANSSIMQFQDDEDLNAESVVNINQTQLDQVKVSVKNHVDGISKIFDPENSSLLYLDKNKVEKMDGLVLKSVDTNATTSKSKSKIPIRESMSAQKRVSKSHQLKSSTTSQRNQSKKIERPSSQFDLRFPKLDHLILRLAEQRSLR